MARVPSSKLTHVLFVRTNDDLIKMLNRLLDRRRRVNPHSPMSLAALVRDLLWNAVKEELEQGGRK